MAGNLKNNDACVIDGKAAKCVRCKQACKVVEDCYEHEFGKTRFEESLCCGAPVVWVRLADATGVALRK